MTLDVKLIPTGKFVLEFLTENEIVLSNLAETCGVSVRTIYRFINGECRLTTEIAEGIHKLLPDLSVEYLIKYDAKYQYQKEKEAKTIGITEKEAKAIISKFKLKKFYPEFEKDNIALFDYAASFLGYDNLKNGTLYKVAPSLPRYSKANKAEEKDTLLWTTIAYNEVKKKYQGQGLRDFDRSKFDNAIESIKKISGATTLELTKFNIETFCNNCGINFIFRPSIPNARVKGIAVKDEDGRVYLLLSDLFKCIERIWLTFIHEILHIKNGDIDKDLSLEIDERQVDEDVIRFLVDNDMQENRDYSLKEISCISRAHKVPLGLVAEIARFRSNNYKNYAINSLIHTFR